ncbi:hypothetical protein Brsp07_05414 [Brucella sp. NBRC 14130]|uniref:hypothetical protein n=1 Tax=Brucella sp. NBRC 14130 TaxID=3075483 RepID=UPI0030956C5B
MYSIFHVRFDSRCYTFLALILISIFTSTAYAGAAERKESIYDAAMKSRNGIGVSNVRAANDMINADITQRVTVDGSNATINTKVSIPANDDSFKRNTAKHAKNLLKGGAYAAGAAAAMKVILDGVGWVIDEGGKVNKKPVQDNTNPHLQNCYQWNGNCVASMAEAVTISRAYSVENYPSYNITSHKVVGGTVNFYDKYGLTKDIYTWGYGKNPNYNPSAQPPQNTPVSDGEMEDAFYNWFKNNTHSLTDPVTTYIYSPKDSQGNALPKSPPGSDPSFGPNEITDEMMDNYMEHRDANMRNPYTTSIQDSTQTDTTQNPDGSKTTTTTNPDGSKTTTRTDTKTDPDTGEVTTTVTETTTMPDGSTSTKTETSTQTKPKPETTELPAFCEYAATLCTWINKDIEHKADEKSLWDKIKEFFDDTPDTDNDDTEIEIEEPEKPTEQVKLPTSNSECPSLIYNFDLRTFKAQADFSPVWLCEIAEGLYYFFVGLGWYLAACILGWRSS